MTRSLTIFAIAILAFGSIAFAQAELTLPDPKIPEMLLVKGIKSAADLTSTFDKFRAAKIEYTSVAVEIEKALGCIDKPAVNEEENILCRNRLSRVAVRFYDKWGAFKQSWFNAMDVSSKVVQYMAFNGKWPDSIKLPAEDDDAFSIYRHRYHNYLDAHYSKPVRDRYQGLEDRLTESVMSRIKK